MDIVIMTIITIKWSVRVHIAKIPLLLIFIFHLKRGASVQLYASEINTEKLIESKFYETLPISISNVLSNFLYLSPIFLVLEYSIIKIKRINLRKITLNLNRVLVVPYRSDFESFIAMRHFQAVPLLFPWILPRLQPISPLRHYFPRRSSTFR